MDLKKIILSVMLVSALLLAGCTGDLNYDQNDGMSNKLIKNTSVSESFYSNWDGERVTPEIAEANDCIMLEGSDKGEPAWKDFLIDIGSSAKAEITVCTADSVMYVSENSSGSSALIQIKEKVGDRVVSKGRIVSPVEVCCVFNDEKNTLDYYLSDCLLYSVNASGTERYNNVPAEFESHKVSSTAAVTFPYQKCFSSYSDFENYYDKYHDSLGLDSLKTKMSAYDKEGGFNTHVVFLYGDMSSGQADYEFLRAVEYNGQLTVYIRRSFTKNTGTVSKWQLTCAVPSEYLSDVAPDAVTWVIYDDEESRG